MIAWPQLDDRTRRLMLAELAADVEGGDLSLSNRLTEVGLRKYPGLLEAALRSGTEATLADDLRRARHLEVFEPRKSRRSSAARVAVPANAPEVLAEGEFNRFYMRAICRAALEDGITELEIFRVKEVLTPRPESTARVGARIDARELLTHLRNPKPDRSLGFPVGPNSGLSVRRP